MKMWIVWAIGAVLVTAIAIYLIGVALPADHIATGEALVAARSSASPREFAMSNASPYGVTALPASQTSGGTRPPFAMSKSPARIEPHIE